MKERKKTKYLHEGKYVAEVEVVLYDDESGWSPYLCMEDAYRLDEARAALRQNDIEAASKYGKIYELRQVTNG